MSFEKRCQQIRDKWASIDHKDPKALLDFFTSLKFLTTNDIAQILGRHAVWIATYKRRAGIKGKWRPPRAYCSQHKIIDVPENWRTKEWLEQTYAKYGRRIIARSAGVGSTHVYMLLKKFGIKPVERNTQHPLCNKEWLVKHYIELDWSASQCAKAAGVRHPTIVHWLNKFKIQAKDERRLPIVGETGGVGYKSTRDRRRYRARARQDRGTVQDRNSRVILFQKDQVLLYGRECPPADAGPRSDTKENTTQQT